MKCPVEAIKNTDRNAQGPTAHYQNALGPEPAHPGQRQHRTTALVPWRSKPTSFVIIASAGASASIPFFPISLPVPNPAPQRTSLRHRLHLPTRTARLTPHICVLSQRRNTNPLARCRCMRVRSRLSDISCVFAASTGANDVAPAALIRLPVPRRSFVYHFATPPSAAPARKRSAANAYPHQPLQKPPPSPRSPNAHCLTPPNQRTREVERRQLSHQREHGRQRCCPRGSEPCACIPCLSSAHRPHTQPSPAASHLSQRVAGTFHCVYILGRATSAAAQRRASPPPPL